MITAKPYLTNAGAQLLTEEFGSAIYFTRFCAGDGEYPTPPSADTMRQRTALLSPVLSFDADQVKKTDEAVNISGELKNSEIPEDIESFYLRELGLFGGFKFSLTIQGQGTDTVHVEHLTYGIPEIILEILPSAGGSISVVSYDSSTGTLVLSRALAQGTSLYVEALKKEELLVYMYELLAPDWIVPNVVISETRRFNLSLQFLQGETAFFEEKDSYLNVRLTGKLSFNGASDGVAGYYQGNNAAAMGTNSKAKGYSSFAEGFATETRGAHSHAEGENTVAIGDNQHVQGAFNVLDADGEYLHVVGNGTADNARSNAHTLDRNGNAWFAGGVELTDTVTGDRYRITIASGQIQATKISE